MNREPFVIDLNDPDDLRVKLREAREILRSHEERLRELREVERAVVDWTGTVTFLASKVPEDDEDAPQREQRPIRVASAQVRRVGGNTGVGELAVSVVNRNERPITPKEVTEILGS